MMIAGDMIGEILTSVVVLTKLDVALSLSLVVILNANTFMFDRSGSWLF